MAPEVTLRVLLVDDDQGAPPLSPHLIEELGAWATEVVRVDGHRAAVEAVEERLIDVVLVDERLRSGSGLEFLRDERVRAVGTPVIVLTRSGRGAELEAAAAGAADYLDRGEVTGDILARSVRYAVESYRRSRAERLSQALIENARDLITVLDAHGRVEFVSPSLRRILGREPEERVGGDFRQDLHPEDVERVREGIQSLLNRPGGTWSFRIRARHRDGSWRLLDSEARNLLDDPLVGGVVVNSWDVTDLAWTEEALRSREELLSKVMASLPAITFVLDGEGRFTLSEGRGLEGLGLAPGEVLGRSALEMYQGYPGIHRDLERALAGHSFQSVRRVEGRVFEIRWSPLAEGPGAVGVAVDITERALAQERQDRLLGIIDASPDFISIVTADLEVEHVNPAGRRITGVGPDEELRGLPVSTFHPDWAMERLKEEALPRAMRGEPWRGENALLTVDGEEIRVWQVVAAHRDESEEVSFFSTVCSDLTERERAADQIRFQAALLDEVGQAVIATDLEGRVTYWNRAAERLYGWSAEEAVGGEIRNLTTTRSDRHRADDVMEHVRAGNTWSGEFTVRGKDGGEFPALVTNAPLHDRDGELVGMVGVSSNLTRQKGLEAELRNAQKMEAVGRLAGGIAHDYNNLLTVIYGHVDLILPALPADSALLPDLEAVHGAARRAAELTRQLLAFSRRQMLDERVLDLRVAVAEMETMLRRLVPENISMALHLAKEPAPVRADPAQISQVTLNLVLNAIDAMSEGGGRLDVSVKRVDSLPDGLERAGSELEGGPWVRLSVRDTGIGMTEDVMERVFEPFFTTKEVGKGTGLGLSTVFGIVKQTGGDVLVDSAPWEGSVFHVLLPVVDGAEDDDWAPTLGQKDAGKGKDAGSESLEGEKGVEEHAGLEPFADAEDPGGTRTILVVEDDETVRRFTKRVLGRAGYGVVEARNGLEALSVAEGFPWPIDLVLSDVVMPEMGGGELVERLRVTHPDLGVILTSGYAREELPGGLAELRVPFLAKPFDVEDLLKMVGKALDE